MPRYDHPFFKRLAQNDLGQGSNQGGPAIPVALRPFFPPLPDPRTGPTEEFHIVADLFDGDVPVATTTCRWHYQTWAGTRGRETRLTQNIAPRLLSAARAGDLLVFEREFDTLQRYRITLVRQGTPRFRDIERRVSAHFLASKNAWGPIDEAPLALAPLDNAIGALLDLTNDPFALFGDREPVPASQLFRSAAFSRIIRKTYDTVCNLCNAGLIAPVDDASHEPPTEVEAAHIVGVAFGGTDDPRNGICLCRSHHWAFDHGLVYADADMRWRVAPRVLKEPRNHDLSAFDMALVSMPADDRLRPAEEAFAFHREKVAIVK